MSVNKKYEIKKLEDLIYRVEMCEGADVETADVREIGSAFLQLANGRKFAVLCDSRNAYTVSPEARVLLAGKEFSHNRIARAFIVNSFVGKLAGNFFIRFNKPEAPTKLFADEESAMKWLKYMIQKNQKNKISKPLVELEEEIKEE